MIGAAVAVPLIVASCGTPAVDVAIRPATVTSTATATATTTATVARATVRTTTTATVIESADDTTTPVRSPAPSTTGATGARAPVDEKGRRTWPAGNRVGVAPSPSLDGRLSGWTLVSTWTSTVRAVAGSFTPAPGSETDDLRFPALTSGCERQRFLVVWTAATAGPQITAGFATAPSGTGAVPVVEVESATTSGAGWMAVDACRIPAFRLSPSSAAANFSDMFVSVERYEPVGS